MDDDAIHNLIGTIYEAALEPSKWAIVVKQLKTATRSHHAHLWLGNVSDNIGNFILERNKYLAFEDSGLSIEDLSGIGKSMQDASITDPHLQNVDRARLGKAQLGCAIVPLDEYERSPFYNDFGKQVGMYRVLASIVSRRGEGVDAISFFRSAQEAPYAETDVRLLDNIIPHIRRSLQFYMKLQAARTQAGALQNSIDVLRSAMILINQKGGVIFLNAAAEHLIKRRQELFISRGRLRAKARNDASQLEWLTRVVTGLSGQRPIGGAVAIQSMNGEAPLQVLATPVPVDAHLMLTNHLRAVALLVIHDPNEKAYVPIEIVANIFGLTPAEAKLVLALSNGQTLKEFTEEAQVSLNTARTHLRSVFAKTKTARQSDIVRLMAGLTHSVTLFEHSWQAAHDDR
jgi:DNA-binding CsgD family transcriptional regulator